MCDKSYYYMVNYFFLASAMKVPILVQLQYSIYIISAILIVSVTPDYRAGIGISDVTGPIVQIPFLGYANMFQRGSGIHMRQFARAFIIEEDSQRIAFISVDVAMVSDGLRQKVLEDLGKMYGVIYSEQNLIISATHTHSAPGGHMMELLLDISTFGFVHQTFNALRRGIVKAVTYAHESIQEAKIFISSGILLEANINRSPLAYLLNPKAERDEYEYDVDKEMVQLQFIAKHNNTLLGVINWFAVHPTSMNNTNTLVSSDNVGYASILFEQHINKDKLIGQGPFVAAFCPSNLGDVSPNTKGPRCINTGAPCDNVTSTCDGRSQQCIAFGPGENMLESTKIIGEHLFKKSLELLDSSEREELLSGLMFAHQYIDMPTQQIDHSFANGSLIKIRGCLPAMGYSFAAGTTDGPGPSDFTQGTVSDNPLWNFVRDLLATPTYDDITCHYPKPIFLATGRIKVPYRWQPRVVSIQVAIIAHVVIAAVPGEFSTMSGRRLRKLIENTYSGSGSQRSKVIIAGLSNTYTSYIATREEYELQRYEGASTIFGPYTLDIYLHLYRNLINSLIAGQDYDKGEAPQDISRRLLSFTLPVLYDLPLLGHSFGDCIQQPPNVQKGDVATAIFVSANPRNNLLLEKTFLTVEKQVNSKWIVVATDANWETTMTWKSLMFITGTSQVTIQWHVGKDTPSGTYRIRHFGYSKPFFGNIKPYQGSTRTFTVY